MKRCAGVNDARKVSYAGTETQRVLVVDACGEVWLSLSTSSYPAGLTPEQARHIAAMLIESAGRVGKSVAPAATPKNPLGGESKNADPD